MIKDHLSVYQAILDYGFPDCVKVQYYPEGEFTKVSLEDGYVAAFREIDGFTDLLEDLEEICFRLEGLD